MDDHIIDTSRLCLHHIPGPCTEAATRVHGPHPSIESHPLSPVLLRVLALYLQHQLLAICQLDKEVRHELPLAASLEVVDVEPEVVVLGKGLHFCTLLKHVGG